eukprot:TRINITY_DN66823_c3_g4_i1.p2 TRINITY_DN66823_c3_g4~~TRINITY_DN66823_c3_g4_i1.p2  ORF type:complete len:357 (+),score=32.77 TRINITY_DN66823_c3_g4_i1:28-1098(+)
MRWLTKHKKNADDLCKALNDSFVDMNKKEGNKKTAEDSSRLLNDIYVMLYGKEEDTGANESEAERVTVLLTHDEYTPNSHTQNVLLKLILNLEKFEYESRKLVSAIFCNIMRRKSGGKHLGVEYMVRHADIVNRLIIAHDDPAVTGFVCSSMLRECIKHEVLAKLVLHSEHFWSFFDYMNMANFEGASDAFKTFEDTLTKNPAAAADFMNRNYEKFFEKYNLQLTCGNYVVRRQSLKLLAELLLDRVNFYVMRKYIGDLENLKIAMEAIADTSEHIQFEAFHVFKVFVVNPEKLPVIHYTLHLNKQRLLAFFKEFQQERGEKDDVFKMEKQMVIDEITNLQPLRQLPWETAPAQAP